MVRPLDQCDGRPAGLNRQQRKKGASPPTLASILTMLCARQPFSCEAAPARDRPPRVIMRLIYCSLACLLLHYVNVHTLKLIPAIWSGLTIARGLPYLSALWPQPFGRQSTACWFYAQAHISIFSQPGAVKDVLFRHEVKSPNQAFKQYPFLCFLHSSLSSRNLSTHKLSNHKTPVPSLIKGQ